MKTIIFILQSLMILWFLYLSNGDNYNRDLIFIPFFFILHLILSYNYITWKNILSINK